MQGLGLALFAAIASYPIAWLADRFDRRLILCIGIAVWSIATAACAFQTTFEGLLIATIGIAVGEAGLGPIVWAVIPDLFPGRQPGHGSGAEHQRRHLRLARRPWRDPSRLPGRYGATAGDHAVRGPARSPVHPSGRLASTEGQPRRSRGLGRSLCDPSGGQRF